MEKHRGCFGLPWAVWLPGLYVAFAIYIWVDFTTINRDGLANVGLFVATAPVTIFGLVVDAILGSKKFSLLPTGNGYVTDHAIYYVPAVAVTALLFWLVGRAIDRRRG